MAPQRLDWDSDFFGVEVFHVGMQRSSDVRAVIGSMRQMGARLCYIFLKEPDAAIDAQLVSLGAILYDEKITYGKTLQEESVVVSPAIETYTGELNDRLVELAFQAGHESRFRKDPRLQDRFEPLYRLWMVKSLNGTMADRVFVYRVDGEIKGMALCKIRDDRSGNIGLIASDADSRGKGIGKSLVDATEDFYRSRQVKSCTVVTQRSNVQACRFYEKAGFRECQAEFVYHLWLD